MTDQTPATEASAKASQNDRGALDKTPATEAGRAFVAWVREVYGRPEYGMAATVSRVLAIEAEARADAYRDSEAYTHGRADALREAADAVRAIPVDEWHIDDSDYVQIAAVLAILDPQP